jgi:AcrR family transcriptional regulator
MEIILNRKDRFIITAIEIIGELGIQGLSTREIARRQGVSEATLFRHYKSKSELMLAVLDYFTQFDKDIYQSIRIKKLTPKEAIVYLMNAYAGYYESYPDITSIMQIFDVLSFEPNLTEKVKSIVSSRTCFIKELVDDAQKIGEIKSDIDSESLANIITGFFREICLKWRLEDKAFSLKERTLSILKDVLDSFSSK